MENKLFKPLIDKLFFAVWIPTGILMLAATILSLVEPAGFIIMLGVDAFALYFLLSSLVGYVELRENSVFIKCGFFLKRDIPYDGIRDIQKERRIYSESMISLKNAIEQVNIKYGKFDVITVSVAGNDELIEQLRLRMAKNTNQP